MFCLRLQVIPTHLGPIGRAILCLRTGGKSSASRSGRFALSEKYMTLVVTEDLNPQPISVHLPET
jgi:hypothetical protein